MTFRPLRLPGSYEIVLSPRADERGVFTRLLCMNELKEIGHERSFVQVNLSRTQAAGTVRGMHFQNSPFAETKIVTCLRGCVFDVIVDLRRRSSTFLQWQAIELSAEDGRMVYIPEGFAHGFQALAADSELLYFHTEFYRPQSEGGVRYDDPSLQIRWPRDVVDVSTRDLSYPRLQRNAEESSIL